MKTRKHLHSIALSFAAAAAVLHSVSSIAAPSSPAVDNRPVTQEQFKQLLRVYKNTLDRFDKLEAQVKSGSKGGGEEAVDLTNLSSTSATTPPVATPPGPPGAPQSPHAKMGSSVAPDFRIYFDFNLVSRPGVENLSFDNFHSFLLLEILPTPEIMFSFDVSTTPRYFELDYQIHPRIQLRWGKIWIPFDDMAPHNIFGGRINVSRLAVPGAPAFLPDIWTDLGMGVNFLIVDSSKFKLEAKAYVVNGFRDGGKDPINPETGSTGYPSFSDLPTSADNNLDKAFGGRLNAVIGRVWGLGASIYNGRWNSDTQSPGRRLTILGGDTQLRFSTTEFRAGLVSMLVNLPTGSTANRGGAYVELGQKFGRERQFKALVRAGLQQLDDRALDTSTQTVLGDQQIVGAALIWKPNFIQYSIEHMRDFKYSPNKPGYTFTNFRIVMTF